jgi:TPR repeat protein
MDAYNRGDYATALREWRPLAEQGNAAVQFNLGTLYYNGQGVPQDYVQARQWYEKAAAQGDANAQFNLGVLYYEGQGVLHDDVQAHMWACLAAANGHKKAVDLRDRLARKMTPAQIALAQQLAREWKPKGQ